MDRATVLEQVRQVLDEELGVEPEKIVPSANLRDDLEMDSLDLVELVAVLEDRIGHGIRDDAADDIRTVDDIIDVVVRATAAAQESTATP